MVSLSVIVPVYKVEKYLHRCIDSILNQDFSDYELILVDDGSPDKCGVICDEYEKKDSRIKVIHKENGGLSSARNAGIDIMSGEYVTFIDSDDFIHPSMFSSMMGEMKNQNADISICSFLRTSEKVDYPDTSLKYKAFNNTESVKMLYSVGISFITAWGKIYKSSLFENIRYPHGKYHEDEFTTYKLLYSAKKVIFTEDRLYFYYVNPESIIQSSFSEKHLDALDAFVERTSFFLEKKEKALAELSAHALISRIMYSHQCLWREKNLKNKSLLIKKALSYLDKSQKKGYISSLSSKQQLWAKLFFLSPKLYSFTRNLMKIGL